MSGASGAGSYSGSYNPSNNAFGSIASGIVDRNLPNPATGAQQYLNQIPGQIAPYYNQQIANGWQAGNNLNGQFNQLLNNPGGFVNSVGSNFHQSPGFQFQVGQATNAANEASAAGGMAGSPQEQQNLATTVNGLANQDYYNYLDTSLGEYNQGLAGEQNMYNVGANAGNELATNIGQNLTNEGNLAYAGQINENQQQAGGAGSIFGGIGELFGGGGSSGGGAVSDITSLLKNL